MADFGLKIAKRNHGIEDGDRYQIFHSKYPALKLAFVGTGTLTKSSGSDTQTVEVTHSLGYVPICYVHGEWYDDGVGSVGTRFARWNRWWPRGVQTADFYYHYADTTKLYIVLEMSNLSNAQTLAFDYMYHIFYDEDTLA